MRRSRQNHSQRLTAKTSTKTIQHSSTRFSPAHDEVLWDPLLLALLGLSLVLCSHSASSQPDLDLDLDLRHHRLLQRARAAGMSTQEWSKRAVEDLLSQLSLPEEETQDREVSTVGAAKDDLHMERSAETNNIPPKDRKSGCKNFFWKGRTSC
ncbi:somatostatin 1.2 [Clupea harengus]|uniref:Somatostatin-2 n=1 Tax=Clupea harengus TaxID=7950 RepID=A0A6P3WAX4_CLUHA|nr:somatostatin 1.2 [Clupea harengus]